MMVDFVFQTGLIHKVLEDTWMYHCNGFPTHTMVRKNIGKDDNSPKSKRYCTNSYASIIGMMLYFESNKRPYIYFNFHQCEWFTQNIKASHETKFKRIFWYLKGTKEKGLVFQRS